MAYRVNRGRVIHLDYFKHVEVNLHGKIRRNKLYKCTCDNCGADRGYKAKSYKAPLCNKCSHKGISLSEDTKAKMSIAAFKRYNDPTWKAKDYSKVGHHRNRNRIYKVKNSPLQRKLKHRTKTLLWQKLTNRSLNKSGSTFDLLGYTVDDLINRLESKFKSGMTWDNYGLNGWEIDHVIPDSWFTYSSVEDQGFKDSWALENLQPEWADLNRSKGASYAG